MYLVHLSSSYHLASHYSRKQIVQAHIIQEGFSKSEKQFAEILMTAGCFEHFQVCVCSGLRDYQRRHSNAIEVQTVVNMTVAIKTQCLFGSDILRSKKIVLKRSLPERLIEIPLCQQQHVHCSRMRRFLLFSPALRSTMCRSVS